MALVHDCQIKAPETISEKENSSIFTFQVIRKFEYFMSLEKEI